MAAEKKVEIIGQINFGDFVENQKSRRSRGGGSPELLDLPGFPLSRE
jgi:hypothetical protein